MYVTNCYNINMQKQVQEYRQVLETNPVAVHRLKNGWKMIRDIGHLIVYQQSNGVYWYNINHGISYELVKDTVFYKIVYENFTSYLWEVLKGGFVAFSFENGSAVINQWEDVVRKIGSLENFAKAVESPTTHKKIEYHCSDVEKTSIHQENILTPLLKWGGIAQDTVVGGAASMMDRNSHEDGVVQKTKTFVRSSWNTLRGKFNDMRHAVAERFQSKPEAA